MDPYSSWDACSWGEERILQRGPFQVDLLAHHTLFEGRPLSLPPCVFNYLVTLLKFCPEPVSYQTLVSASQGDRLPRLDAQDLARARIYILRKAVEENYQHPHYIRAVPGYGYQLVC